MADHGFGAQRRAYIGQPELESHRVTGTKLCSQDGQHSALAQVKGASRNVIRNPGTQYGYIHRDSDGVTGNTAWDDPDGSESSCGSSTHRFPSVRIEKASGPWSKPT